MGAPQYCWMLFPHFTEMSAGLRQVGRDKKGAMELTWSDRNMWQSLLETCCRKGCIAEALQVTHSPCWTPNLITLP